MLLMRLRLPAVVLVACLAGSGLLARAEEPNLTEDQMRSFLLTAKVINSKQLSKGITAPWRLTLNDGNLTHDAAFQSIDERSATKTFSTGRTEMNFRDSYHFNIAAFEVAKLVGLGDMMPVTVERKWNGKTGALAWWVPWKWDEGMRIKENVQPPDAEAWNRQMYRMRVFAQLVYDTDRNLTNVLITEDWKLWMIDFTRAFRLLPDLENAKNLTHFDRQLLEKLKQLDPNEVEQKTKPHIGKSEIKAMMTRRDKILGIAQQLAAQKGESEVLY